MAEILNDTSELKLRRDQLSTLCNEDDATPYSVKSADDIPDFSSFESDEDELKDSFQFEDENGNVIEDEEYDAYDDGSDEF